MPSFDEPSVESSDVVWRRLCEESVVLGDAPVLWEPFWSHVDSSDGGALFVLTASRGHRFLVGCVYCACF